MPLSTPFHRVVRRLQAEHHLAASQSKIPLEFQFFSWFVWLCLPFYFTCFCKQNTKHRNINRKHLESNATCTLIFQIYQISFMGIIRTCSRICLAIVSVHVLWKIKSVKSLLKILKETSKLLRSFAKFRQFPFLLKLLTNSNFLNF